MGDFEFGYRPKPIRFLDQKLTLDPEIQRAIAEIELRMAANRVLPTAAPISDCCCGFDRGSAKPPNIFANQTRRTAVYCVSPRGSGRRRACGQLSDVTGASISFRSFRGGQEGPRRGLRQLRVLKSEWTNRQRAARSMVSTRAWSSELYHGDRGQQETRDLAFGLIKDRDIPIRASTACRSRYWTAAERSKRRSAFPA